MPQIDALLDAARSQPVPAQRYALLGQAAARIDDAQLFIPIAAPMRWSLVAGPHRTASPGTASPATRSPTWSRSPAAETEAWRYRKHGCPSRASARDPQSVRQRVEAMEHLLERLFVIPGHQPARSGST